MKSRFFKQLTIFVIANALILCFGAFYSFANQSASEIKVSINKPLVIAFMGIPASGKSTVATNLASLIDAKIYLEGEKTSYPDDVKECFSNRDKKGAALRLYEYFRSIRINHLKSAIVNKEQGKSVILDSFFDKLFYDMLDRNGVNWIIDPNHVDFPQIKQIAYIDKNKLPDVDVVIFLNISKNLHKTFHESRNHTVCDLDGKIFTAQEAFLDVTRKYTEANNKILIVVDQEKDIHKVIRKILIELKNLELVS
jgi:thymidylate kinase